MKHLLRNIWTSQYFTHGKWTSDVTLAQNFTTPLAAMSYSLRNNLKDVEMVLVLGAEPSPLDDISIPLSATYDASGL